MRHRQYPPRFYERQTRYYFRRKPSWDLCLERFLLLATMDISAHAISLADRPQWAIRVTSFRMRREDRSSISFDPLADLGGEGVSLSHLALPFWRWRILRPTH
jgi:hypothetical protein